MRAKIFSCESREDPVCPHCGELLRYRDRRKRLMKWYNGEQKALYLRRLRCTRCKRLHNELPDFLVPHKHYAAEIIENVVDDVSTPDDLSTENYPCERTMQRWKDWIRTNKHQIDGYLKSIGSRVSVSGYELLKSGDSLLQKLRDNGAGWLAIVNRAIYNTGGKLLTILPSRPVAPALSYCPEPP